MTCTDADIIGDVDFGADITGRKNPFVILMVYATNMHKNLSFGEFRLKLHVWLRQMYSIKIKLLQKQPLKCSLQTHYVIKWDMKF